MKLNPFTKVDEKNGYPFFAYSSFYIWIIYKNNLNKKYVRYSIETRTTISQLITFNTNELQLNRQAGFMMLLEFIKLRADKIHVARIYSTLPELKGKYFHEFKNGKFVDENFPEIIFQNPILNFNFEVFTDPNKVFAPVVFITDKQRIKIEKYEQFR